MPRQTHASIAHKRRVHASMMLKPFQESMAHLAQSTSSAPAHFSVNLLVWNASDKLGEPTRVGLHPSVGVRSWQSVVSTVFEGCAAGIGGSCVHTATGTAIRSYGAFMEAFSAEKVLHAQRLAFLVGASRQHQANGPTAPVAHRVANDDVVERVFHFDVVCCARGVPFQCPKALQRVVDLRAALDAQLQETREAEGQHGPQGAATPLAAFRQDGKHHSPRPRMGPGGLPEDRVFFFHSSMSQTRRRDNPMVHRAVAAADQERSCDGGNSGHDGDGVGQHLLNVSTRLRRMSTDQQLVVQGSHLAERAQAMRREMLASLRKEDIPEGALNQSAIDTLHEGIAFRKQSLTRLESMPPPQSSSAQRRRLSCDVGSPTREADASQQGPKSSFVWRTRRSFKGHESPTNNKRASSPTGFDSPNSSSCNNGNNGNKGGETSPDSAAQTTVCPTMTFSKTSSISFPLGVVRNRLGEFVKIDGGPVLPGSLVTSSASGELYKVEWLNPATNVAHCRWVARATDPCLAHFVQCSEDSLVQKAYYGPHYEKYEFHWLRRMEVAHRAVEARSASHDDTVVATPPDSPGAVTPIVDDLDDTMIKFGGPSGGMTTLPPEALARHRHHASPVKQRRMQRHGGHAAFGNGGYDDSDDGSEDDGEGGALPLHLGLRSTDVAVLRDFEALFPANKQRDMLRENIRSNLPHVVVSKQVSFLTDVCLDLKLSTLKPTTTFRFLMWLDMGFVLSLYHLMSDYGLVVPEGPHGQFSLPLPPQDFANRTGDDATHLSCSRETGAKHVRFRTLEDGVGKTDPMEGCLSHERQTGAEGVLNPEGTVTSEQAGVGLCCCVCKQRGYGAQCDAPADPPSDITLIM